MDTIYRYHQLQHLTHLFQSPQKIKCYKQRVNPFDLPNKQFKYKYRLEKETILKIIEMVRDDITNDPRGGGISPELQVLVAIRCWARREVQDDAGDLHGLSQPSVSRICARVARAIARHAKEYIKMPQNLGEEQVLMRQFKEIKNFPGVIGAIDGTHIQIKKTGGDLAQYYINRKGYSSLNVQAVCDANLKILDIVARWRGSTHDCRIFNESHIKQQFDENKFKGRLLGDSGYKLLPYLFTPLNNPQSNKEKRYNSAHIRTRNTVERCFGVWKQRFRCLLDGVTCSLENAKAVIVALAVIHNIAIDENDPLPEDEDVQNNVPEPEIIEDSPVMESREQNRNKLIRKHFIEKYF